MNAYQMLVTRLLLATEASRAAIYLRGPGEALEPAAEAVQHGAEQIRNVAPGAEVFDRSSLAALETGEIVTHDDLGEIPRRDDATVTRDRAEMLAPLIVENQLAGVIALGDARGPRPWDAQARDALEGARTEALGLLEAARARAFGTSADDLRAAAVQAVLDRLRQGLGVQRCTYRRPVLEAYAFPVTYESRAAGVRALLGDFTIVQTGQPVITKLLQGRAQVVQPDTRAASDEPIFHVMLKHYGDMRAQIVTPYIVGDQLEGVLSVHELSRERDWSPEEQQLAADATRLIGRILAA